MEIGDIGKPYIGNAYRVDIENWGISRNATVADVIRFEREELGNKDDVSNDMLKELDNYRSRDAIWVTKKKSDAEFYLSEGMSSKDISKMELPPNSRIIAEDGQGGYLVLRGDAKPIKNIFPKFEEATEKIPEVEPIIPEVTIKEINMEGVSRFEVTHAAFPYARGHVTLSLEPNYFVITGLNVEQVLQRKGIGSALIMKVLDRAKLAGKPIIIEKVTPAGDSLLKSLEVEGLIKLTPLSDKLDIGVGKMVDVGGGLSISASYLIEPAISAPEVAPKVGKQDKQEKARQWVEDEGIADLSGKPIEVNPDGMVTLYHRTTQQAVGQMNETGKFLSKENTNETFFSNKPTGQAEGYGDAIVVVKVPAQDIRINDAFPNEIHVAVSNKKLNKSNIITGPVDYPEAISKIVEDVELLREERRFMEAIGTVGAAVKNEKQGWTGYIVKPTDDPMGRVLVRRKMGDIEVERWYDALELKPGLAGDMSKIIYGGEIPPFPEIALNVIEVVDESNTTRRGTVKSMDRRGKTQSRTYPSASHLLE